MKQPKNITGSFTNPKKFKYFYNGNGRVITFIPSTKYNYIIIEEIELGTINEAKEFYNTTFFQDNIFESYSDEIYIAFLLYSIQQGCSENLIINGKLFKASKLEETSGDPMCLNRRKLRNYERK